MYGNKKDLLLKGSVRSLPRGQMQEFRRLFEQKDAEASKQEHKNNLQSYVQSTGAKFESRDVSKGLGDERGLSPGRRQHTSESESGRQSPVRSANPELYPPQYSNFPMPSPRKTMENKETAKADKKDCVSKLPLQKFGEIASGVVMGDLPSQVNNVIGHLESNKTVNKTEPNQDNPVKIPLRPQNIAPRSKTPSPARSQSSASPKRSPVPPKRPQPQTQTQDENNGYSCLWNAGSSANGTSNHISRTPSVLERSKIFENTTPGAPARPQPPVRQRSQNDDSSANEAPNTQKKGLPPRPPVRQRSQSGGEKENRLETSNTNTTEQTQNKQPPPPPSKPPRTGAHDDYMKVKLEKETSEKNRVTFEESEHDNNQTQSLGIKERLAMFDSNPTKKSKDLQKLRPKRPPPPFLKKKPRPFSIASDSFNDFRGSEDSDLDNHSDLKPIDDNPFYETVPSEKDVLSEINDLKHWDLPRSSHPEPFPLRRSLSAECVQKAVDDEGKELFRGFLWLV